MERACGAELESFELLTTSSIITDKKQIHAQFKIDFPRYDVYFDNLPVTEKQFKGKMRSFSQKQKLEYKALCSQGTLALYVIILQANTDFHIGELIEPLPVKVWFTRNDAVIEKKLRLFDHDGTTVETFTIQLVYSKNNPFILAQKLDK